VREFQMATTKRRTVSNNPLDRISSKAEAKFNSAVSASADSVKTKVIRSKSVPKKIDVASTFVESERVVKAKPRSGQQRKKEVVKSDNRTKTNSVVVTDDELINQPHSIDSAQGQNASAEDILALEFGQSNAVVKVNSEAIAKKELISNVDALRTVKSWSQWAVVAGFVPVPVADTIAISGVQIKMIHELCRIYDVTFKKEAAVAVVSGLVGGKLTTSVARVAGGFFLSNMPVVGTLMKYTTQPALSYASTYALGRVFVRHFESSGTMVDLDSEKLATYFKEQYAKGRKLFKAEFKTNGALKDAA